MNKPKQKTLFQSWGKKSPNETVREGKSSTSSFLPSKAPTDEYDVVDLCQDDDDDLLSKALEESMLYASRKNVGEKAISDAPSTNKWRKSCIRSSQQIQKFGQSPEENSRLFHNYGKSQTAGSSTEFDTGNVSLGADDIEADLLHSSTNLSGISALPGFDKAAGRLWIYPTNYPVRDYQYNIVQTALFKNTLVTLPTGLGKTFIAAVVMYNFYRWYPQGKIVFMAPTKPLVAQQIEACYKIMGIPQEYTAEMTGSMNPTERRKSWCEKRVFFLTPQVLTNDLTRGTCPVDDIKCLVIDEAHKALGNHAYCQVVRETIKYTQDFRILALSATPGSDIKAVQQVLTNLLISHIEIRTEECIDIKPYTHERKVEKIVIPLGEELGKIKTKFIQVISVVVSRLIRCGVLFRRDPASLSKFLLLKSREMFRQNPPEKLPREQFGVVEGDFALGMSLYHAFELLQLHGLRPFYNFLNSIVHGEKSFGRTRTELLRNADFNDIMDELREKFTDNHSSTSNEQPVFLCGHPKLEKLEEIVLEHFRKFHNASDADKTSCSTRVMIFSQYRDSVEEIRDMLNRHQPMVKVMSFIGQSSAGKITKGFTQKEQLKVMKSFREGGYNTLVSTCVGEEGLDIGDVDLIICFDAHKSPIRLVQRMGRTGRKRKGQIIMLVTEGKEEQIYNQSQYSKKSIHKAILNGAKSLHFYTNNQRMFPEGLSPTCHKMFMTVKQMDPPKTTVKNKTNKSLTKFGISGKKSAVREDGGITREEYEELKEFILPEVEVKTLQESCFRYLCSSKEDCENTNKRESTQTKLSLMEWLPWQNRLQRTRYLDHSAKTKYMVELMEFSELQQSLSVEEDSYGLEMKMYLNNDDIQKPGQNDQQAEGILKFCSRKDKDQTTVEKNPVKSRTKRTSDKSVRSKRSEALPIIEVIAYPDESEEDLPMFDVGGKESITDKRNKNSKKLTQSPNQSDKCQSKMKKRVISVNKSVIQVIADVDKDDFEDSIPASIPTTDVHESMETDDAPQPQSLDGIDSTNVTLAVNVEEDRTVCSQIFKSVSTGQSGIVGRFHVPTPPSVEELSEVFTSLADKTCLPKLNLEKLVSEWKNDNHCKSSKEMLIDDINCMANFDIASVSDESTHSISSVSLDEETIPNFTALKSSKSFSKNTVNVNCENGTVESSQNNYTDEEVLGRTENVGNGVHLSVVTSKSNPTSRSIPDSAVSPKCGLNANASNVINDFKISSSSKILDTEKACEEKMSTVFSKTCDIVDVHVDSPIHSVGFSRDRLSPKLLVTETVETSRNNKDEKTNGDAYSFVDSFFNDDYCDSEFLTPVEETSPQTKPTDPITFTQAMAFIHSTQDNSEDEDTCLETANDGLVTSMHEEQNLCQTMKDNLEYVNSSLFEQVESDDVAQTSCVQLGKINFEADDKNVVSCDNRNFFSSARTVCSSNDSKALKDKDFKSVPNSYLSDGKCDSNTNLNKNDQCSEEKIYNKNDVSTSMNKVSDSTKVCIVKASEQNTAAVISKNSENCEDTFNFEDDFLLPKFDLEFDLDDDIIPPSPSASQTCSIFSFLRSQRSNRSQRSLVFEDRSSFVQNEEQTMNVGNRENSLSVVHEEQQLNVGKHENSLPANSDDDDGDGHSFPFSPSLLEPHDANDDETHLQEMNNCAMNSDSSLSRTPVPDKEFNRNQGRVDSSTPNSRTSKRNSTSIISTNTDALKKKIISPLSLARVKRNVLPTPVGNIIGVRRQASPSEHNFNVSANSNDPSPVRGITPVKRQASPCEPNFNVSANSNDLSPVRGITPVKRQTSPCESNFNVSVKSSDLSPVRGITSVKRQVSPSESTHRSKQQKTPEQVLESSDDEESFIIVKRKKKASDLLDSSVESRGQKEGTRFKTPTRPRENKKQNILQIDTSSDDEFEMSKQKQHTDRLPFQLDDGDDDFIGYQQMEPAAKQKSTDVKISKKKRKLCDYIEYEAVLSGEEGGSSDDESSDMDLYEDSFVNDNTQMTQQDVDMRAVYLKSVRSPITNSGKRSRKYSNVDVFSQLPPEDDTQYMEDSFCVNDDFEDDVEFDTDEEDMRTKKIKGKNPKKTKVKGKKRICHLSDTSTDDEQIFNTQSPHVEKDMSASRKKVIQALISSSDEESPVRLPSGMKKPTSVNEKLSPKNFTTNRTSHLDEISLRVGHGQNVHNQILENICVSNRSPSKGVPLDPDFSKTSYPGMSKTSYPGMSKTSDPEISKTSDHCLRTTSNSSVSKIFDPGIHITSDPGVSKTFDPDLSKTSVSRQSIEKAKRDREERLMKQKLKQEEFRQAMLLKEKLSQNKSTGKIQGDQRESITIASDLTNEKQSDQSVCSYDTPLTSERFHDETSDTSTMLINPLHSSKNRGKLVVLVDSREISGAQDIVSSLRLQHHFHVVARQLTGCDYILSNRLAVDRKQWSEFSNGANRKKLIDRVQTMHSLYDRCCIIVEKDRVKPGEEKSHRACHRSKYVDWTLAFLSQSNIKLLFTDTQGGTATMISELCQLEAKKGMNITVPVDLSPQQEQIFQFYTSIPHLNCTHALCLCHNFKSVSEFLNSTSQLISVKGQMSQAIAEDVYKFIRHKFDLQMLPSRR